MRTNKSPEAQVARLVDAVHTLSIKVKQQQDTIDALFGMLRDITPILAGLASQDQALFNRLENLESRRIHLYLTDNEPCIGQGDWKDTLEFFGKPRTFEEIEEEGYYVRPEEEDRE